MARFFNFRKDASPEERILKVFREELSRSPRAIIVLVIGASRSGKSTLLNFLTLKEYPLLSKKGNITPEAKEMEHFETRAGNKPCTTDSKYKKVRGSEFMVMHGLKGVPPGTEDYDIFFIDTEGFGNIVGISEDLFLGIFSLLGGVGVLIYLDVTGMTDANRVKCLAQNISVSRFLGYNPPKTISIARGSKPIVEEEEDDDEAYNTKLYDSLKKQDEKTIPVFIKTLNEQAVIDEGKISILTMPKCDQIEGIAYKRTVSDLSSMIVSDTSIKSGKELLELISRSYDKVCNIKEHLSGKLTIDSIFTDLLKDFCWKMIKEKREDVLEIFRESNKESSYGDFSSICNGKDSKISNYSEEPYIRFERALKKIIPNLDQVDKDFLKTLKEKSIAKMESDIKGVSAVICEKMGDYKGTLYSLYEANKYLYKQRPSNRLTISSIDSYGNLVDKDISVIVQPECFYGPKNVKMYSVFPVGIKVMKIKTVTTIKDGIFYGKTESTEVKYKEDITDGYRFNFLSKTLVPKDEDKYIKCTYNYNKTWSWIFWATETIEKTIIKVIVDKECNFKLNKYECVRTDWKNTNTPENPTEWNKDLRGLEEFSLEASEHKFPDRENEAKLKYIEFVKK